MIYEHTTSGIVRMLRDEISLHRLRFDRSPDELRVTFAEKQLLKSICQYQMEKPYSVLKADISEDTFGGIPLRLRETGERAMRERPLDAFMQKHPEMAQNDTALYACWKSGMTAEEALEALLKDRAKTVAELQWHATYAPPGVVRLPGKMFVPTDDALRSWFDRYQAALDSKQTCRLPTSDEMDESDRRDQREFMGSHSNPLVRMAPLGYFKSKGAADAPAQA